MHFCELQQTEAYPQHRVLYRIHAILYGLQKQQFSVEIINLLRLQADRTE
jgi:hypothetical protein